MGMSIGPIPFTAIDTYARRFGIVGAEFERFHALISAMDRVHQHHMADKVRGASNG